MVTLQCDIISAVQNSQPGGFGVGRTTVWQGALLWLRPRSGQPWHTITSDNVITPRVVEKEHAQ